MYSLRKLFSLGAAAAVLSSLCSVAMAVPIFQQLPTQVWTQAPQATTSVSTLQGSSYYWPQPQNSLWDLVGTWHGEAMINDHVNQAVVLERCRNGLFVSVSENCLSNGSCGQRTHVGRWHARSSVYTTQLLGEVRKTYGEFVLTEIDPNSPKAHHQFQIASLGKHHLNYQSLETGRHLSMTKLDQPESVGFCRQMSRVVMGY